MPFQKVKHWKNKNIVAKLAQRKMTLFIWKLGNADKMKGVKNRDSNLGNWITTVWLMKLQTLETLVTIRMVEIPYPQL